MNLIKKLDNKRFLSFIILFISIVVALGQIAETRPKYFQSFLDAVGRYFDPIQYMVGFLLINFIFVIIVIKKYETIPNKLLDTLKWYYTILFVNSFVILLFKVIQRSNLINLGSGFTGIGKAYLVLASVRSLTELTITSVALFFLAKGLANYRSLSVSGYVISSKLKKFVLLLIVVKCLLSIPLSFTGFLESRALFAWSLVLSQISLVAVAGLLYWIGRELEHVYSTVFFKYLARIFGINLGLAILTFIYSIGSFQMLQRYSSGEMGSIGGFGQLVYNAGILMQIFINYYTFQALYNYGESYNVESTYRDESSINDENSSNVLDDGTSEDISSTLLLE